jgi:hypothetical protein
VTAGSWIGCRQDAEGVATEYQKALAATPPGGLRPILERQLAEVRGTIAELERVRRAYAGARS